MDEVLDRVVDTVKPTTVALVMIVKNEASVIERALNSVRSLIDYVLICDTGSTDNTQQVIVNWLSFNDVPGEVIEEPWKNFGYNRSYVLEQLRLTKPEIDYAFMLDADEIVEIACDPKLAPGTKAAEVLKQQLKGDLYNVEMRLNATAYALPRITSNRKPFYYRGPAHEWPDCKVQYNRGNLTGIRIVEMSGGAREKDGHETYKRDALLFEEELKRDDLDSLELPRYTFYLAQSWRDANEPEKSLEAYWRRIDLGGWQEEIYISLLNAARLQERLGKPLTEVVKTYKRAMALNPKRLEAVHGVTKALRLADMFHEGFAISMPAIRLSMYTGLFVETWIYDWGLLDEFSICAYYSGQHTMGWLAMQALLCKDLDDVTRKRVIANLRFAQLAKH